MLNIRKNLLAAAVGVALSAGMASQANAVPAFTVSPDGIPGTTGLSPFTATSINGSSSELLTVTSPTTVTGSGFADFHSFINGITPVLPLPSGLDTQYGLYLTFQLSGTSTNPGTPIGQPGSLQNLTSLNFQVFADPGLDDTFVAANTAGTGTAASVTDTNGNDFELGSGTLVSGSAGFNNGGVFLNSKENFALTAAGSNYFTAPVPFYQFAFDEFNNTQSAAVINGNLISINDASGAVDFNRVPEPGSLALIGIALLGLVGLGRRRSA